jgi:Mrp family chromosome partitioning ATPase
MAKATANVTEKPQQRRPVRDEPRPSRTEQAGPVASRWWKTPPQPGPIQARDPAPANDRLVQECKTPSFEAGAVQSPQPPKALFRQVGSVQERHPAIADLVWHLLQESPSGRSAVLLLCDPEPVDVSPAIATLAVAMASQVRGRLLAVDGTLRDAALARLLAAKPDPTNEPRPTLADVLTGKAEWQQAIRGTTLPNLDVLAGRSQETEREDESLPPPTDGWAASLSQLRQEYQLVLIGVSGTASPTTSAITRWADATYLLVRPGQTGQRAARQALRALRRCGGRVLGSLLIQHPALSR